MFVLTIYHRPQSNKKKLPAYQNNITVFKGKDVRISTEVYNQVVVWFKITAGLLVPVVNTSNRIQVRPSLLLIRNAVTTDQGTHYN